MVAGLRDINERESVVLSVLEQDGATIVRMRQQTRVTLREVCGDKMNLAQIEAIRQKIRTASTVAMTACIDLFSKKKATARIDKDSETSKASFSRKIRRDT